MYFVGHTHRVPPSTGMEEILEKKKTARYAPASVLIFSKKQGKRRQELVFAKRSYRSRFRRRRVVQQNRKVGRRGLEKLGGADSGRKLLARLESSYELRTVQVEV